MVNVEVELSLNKQVECIIRGESVDPTCSSESVSFDGNICPEVDTKESPIRIHSDSVREHSKHTDVAILESSVAEEASNSERESCFGGISSQAFRQDQEDRYVDNYQMGPSVSYSSNTEFPIVENPGILREALNEDMDMIDHQLCQAVKEEVSPCSEKVLSVSDSGDTKDAEDIDMVDCEPSSSMMNIEIYSNGHAHPDESALQVDDARKAETCNLKHGSLPHGANFQDGNGIKSLENYG